MVSAPEQLCSWNFDDDPASQDSQIPSGHILSVQSHVCRDYVGNRAASLVLQFLGHEVDIINTVSFSSMYVHEGTVLDAESFEVTIKGLCKAITSPAGSGIVGQSAGVQGIETMDHHDLPVVMTGYIGVPGVLRILCNYVTRWKKLPNNSLSSSQLRLFLPFLQSRSLLFVMDPVIGDNGRPYVSDEMQEEYRTAIAFADIILPNEYELNWLVPATTDQKSPTTDTKPSFADILANIHTCHSRGPSVVFLTSCHLPELTAKDRLLALCSIQNPTSHYYILCSFKKREAYLGGAGDVVSGLLVDRLLRTARMSQGCATLSNWSDIILNVIGTVQAMMSDAVEHGDLSINVVRGQKRLKSWPPNHADIKIASIQGTVIKLDQLERLVNELR